MGEGSKFGELLIWLVFLFGISCFLFSSGFGSYSIVLLKPF